MAYHDTGRWHVYRKAYKKARVKRMLARFYRRIQKQPVVLARYDTETRKWEFIKRRRGK